jgi:transporter family protein
MEFWFVLAILSAFLWGFASIFAKLGTPKLGVTRIVSLVAIIEGIMYFASFYLWHNSVTIDLEYGALAAASSLFGMVAYLCFFESMIDGQVAIVGTISAAYPSLTVLGALVFLSESLTVMQMVGLAAIICGIVTLSYEPNPRSLHAVPKRSLSFALVAFALWGCWSLTSKIAISKIGPGNVFGFHVIASVTVPLIYVWFRRSRPTPLDREKPTQTSWLVGATSLALNVCGTVVFSFALSMGSASLVVPVASAYPLVTVAAALLFLREKLSRLQLTALAFVILGLITIGIVS